MILLFALLVQVEDVHKICPSAPYPLLQYVHYFGSLLREDRGNPPDSLQAPLHSPRSS